MTDLEIITEYRNMRKISDICKEYGLNQSNLIYGQSSKEKEKIVADIIRNEINKIHSEIMLNRRF